MSKKPYMEIEQEEDGRWIAEVSALPGAIAYGATPGEAFAAVRVLESQILKSQTDHEETLMKEPEVTSESGAANETTEYPLSGTLRHQSIASIRKIESRSSRRGTVADLCAICETSLCVMFAFLAATTGGVVVGMGLVILYRYLQR
jgi:predicted RNase H-like HicB family nuclease